MDIFTRTFIAISILFIGWGIYQIHNRALKLRTPSLLADIGLSRPSSLTLVYFTTPTCIPCKTVQRPAIEKLRQQMGSEIKIIEINAAERTDLASRWGVMSVPTIFIFDLKGDLLHINHGVTRVEKLLTQIQNNKTA